MSPRIVAHATSARKALRAAVFTHPFNLMHASILYLSELRTCPNFAIHSRRRAVLLGERGSSSERVLCSILHCFVFYPALNVFVQEVRGSAPTSVSSVVRMQCASFLLTVGEC